MPYFLLPKKFVKHFEYTVLFKRLIKSIYYQFFLRIFNNIIVGITLIRAKSAVNCRPGAAILCVTSYMSKSNKDSIL